LNIYGIGEVKMKNEKKFNKIILPEQLNNFRKALEDEIEEIRKSGLSSTIVYSGRRINNKGKEYWYRFEISYAPTLPADTPCKLIIGNDQYDVTVISFEEKSLIVSSDVALPETIGKARLENGTTVLMERLIQCIENNADKNHKFWDKMFHYIESNEQNSHEGINIEGNNESQNNAINAAISNDVTYIWGPPGTGKTTIIGQIIDKFIARDSSVLIASHTNTAVDGAINKVYQKYIENCEDYNDILPILRYGNYRNLITEEVTLNHQVEIREKDLIKQEEELKDIKEENSKKIDKIEIQMSKYNWIKNNQLLSIDNDLSKVKNLKEKSKKLDKASKDLEENINSIKNQNPEIDTYYELVEVIEQKEEELEEVERIISKQTKFIKEFHNKKEEIRDEIKKHKIYKELKEIESKLLSENHINGEINSKNSKLKEINEELNSLNLKIEQIKKQINEYEQKNSLAKFFSSKKMFEENKRVYGNIKNKINKLKKEKKVYCRLIDDYNKQLQELSILQEKIQAVKPSKNEQYWNNLLRKHAEEYNSIIEELPQNDNKRSNLLSRLTELNSQYEEVETIFNEVELIKKELNFTRENLNNTNIEINKLERNCTNRLYEECKYCMKFNEHLITGTNDERISELKSIYEKLMIELKKIDVEKLKLEKKELEKDQQAINNKLNEIENKKLEIEKEIIRSAKVIGTTLTKSYLSDKIRERSLDVVIIDEASMASIPALWCASLLAEKKIIIVGDFLQLPPIVMAETDMAKEWLGKDIFNHIGADNPKKIKKIKNLIMLNEQYRMEEDIADISNIYYGKYSGLKTNITTNNRLNEHEKFLEWYPCEENNKNVRLIGTNSLHAWVTGIPKGKRSSRLNIFSATLSVEWAFYLLENKLKKLNNEEETVDEPLVLIIAPYRPHADHVESLIEFGYKTRGFKKNLGYINVGTIHSFQGREADIVIFDLVVDEPHWRTNLFIRDVEANKDLRKMFNVAITRARFKLFVIGNYEYCKKKAKNNALSELLDKLTKKYNIEDAKKLLPDITFAPKHEFVIDERIDSPNLFLKDNAFEGYFINDIKKFEEHLIIFSPFITYNRLSILLPFFIDAINADKKITVVTKALSERKKKEVYQYKKCEDQLKSIGVKIIHKKGMHEKLIFIDNKIFWFGSLNALSFTGNTGEIMQRIFNEKLSEKLINNYDIEYIIDVSSKSKELECPICGDEILAKESNSGGIYWGCTNKDFSRNKDQPYPYDGELKCRKCNSKFVYNRKSQPRWVCSENPRHYQIVRESDLKLEKMLALIPSKKELKEIKKYFSEKRKKKEKKSKKSSAKKKNQKSKKQDKNNDGQLSINDL
jgi:hypothetical protein